MRKCCCRDLLHAEPLRRPCADLFYSIVPTFFYSIVPGLCRLVPDLVPIFFVSFVPTRMKRHKARTRTRIAANGHIHIYIYIYI